MLRMLLMLLLMLLLLADDQTHLGGTLVHVLGRTDALVGVIGDGAGGAHRTGRVVRLRSLHPVRSYRGGPTLATALARTLATHTVHRLR
uniref:Putative secreted protein n=1 Tax=Anopheles darlingi TaxID=43151 RepID=A0A2M4DIB9_ANODA